MEIMKDAMAETTTKEIGANSLIFDDHLLIKAYNNSVSLTQEVLAKRLADAKNTNPGMKNLVSKSENSETLEDDVDNDIDDADDDIDEDEDDDESDEVIDSDNPVYVVGSYVRANYSDGIDYEAKIMSLKHDIGYAHIKYIGYDNEEDVMISDLVPSWGKKARQKQFEASQLPTKTSKKKAKKQKISTTESLNLSTMSEPPMPPMPAFKGMPSKEIQYMHAMLKSWYMSGYYTGVYEGVRLTKTKE